MCYFTICIPTYNRGYIIKRTLKSLENQTFKDFQVIIVDDGSSDNTNLVIEDYQKETDLNVDYIKKENGGKHTALNAGIHLAKGKFFVILDSDDTLDKNALLYMKDKWEKSVQEKDKFCGIMGKSADTNGNTIGANFPKEDFVSSYIDFHFGSGFKIFKKNYGDCCECLKTELLKKHQYPTNKHTKFIPESLVTDRIGLNYQLLCTNKILKYVEYLDDGITANNTTFKDKNIVGFIIKYVSNIDEILPNTNVGIISKIFCWWQYWSAIKKDHHVYGPRCNNVSVTGYLVKKSMPFLSVIYNFVIYKRRYSIK